MANISLTRLMLTLTKVWTLHIGNICGVYLIDERVVGIAYHIILQTIKYSTFVVKFVDI